MSRLSALLDVQSLDLSSDALAERRRTLPERESLRDALARAASLDAAHAELLERRRELSGAEREVGTEVADVAAKAKEVEDTLYSGTVKAAKELEALQEEVRLLRERQSGFEEREMELLEEIDRVEGEAAENRAARAQADADAAELRAAIGKAEGEIDDELAALGRQCAGLRDGLPPEVLDEYDKLRTRERLGGRAAAPLSDGTCGACRVRLPVVDYTHIKNQPEDALTCCSHCKRVLVR